jgi:hypothetical protein
MKNLKGQAAMEYLMTYGWAILVVIAVVAALYGLGVFKIGAGPVKCSPCFSTFTYVDYSAGTLVIKNGPRDINITDVTSDPTGATSTQRYQLISAGQTIKIDNIPTTGDVKVTITYTVIESGLSHNETATIHN